MKNWFFESFSFTNNESGLFTAIIGKLSNLSLSVNVDDIVGGEKVSVSSTGIMGNLFEVTEILSDNKDIGPIGDEGVFVTLLWDLSIFPVMA